MLITFSGLDGAGKSTLIERLKLVLEKRNRQVTIFHMNDHVGLYAYLRSMRDWLTGTVRDPNQPPTWKEPEHSRSEPIGLRQRCKRFISHARNFILWNKALRRCIY